MLVAEIMGKRSNIVLLDDASRISGVLQPVSSERNRYRELLPGLPYVAPPPVTKTHPRDMAPAVFDDPGIAGAGLSCEQAVIMKVAGFGPSLAREACLRAGVAPKAVFVPALAAGLARGSIDVWEESVRGEGAHVYLDQKGLPLECHVVHLRRQAAEVRRFASASSALDFHYGILEEVQELEGRRRALKQAVVTHAERVHRRLTSRQQDLSTAAVRNEYKTKGDLILTYLAEVSEALGAHQETVMLTDPATGRPSEVVLDLSLDATGNAQHYYRKYSRAKARRVALAPHIERDATDLQYVSSVETSLDLATTPAELDEISGELEQQGIIQARGDGDGPRDRRKAGSGRTGPGKPSPGRFVTTLGDEVLVGRNNRQNEYLTSRLARPNDIWLHARSVPGAHVVLRSESGETSGSSLEEAAMLAATYSAARESGKVEVDYTQARYVRRPAGSRPGMVLYDHHRTIIARPDPALARTLEKVPSPSGKTDQA
jgi:predicted ribosome quality control (RQC) complex YloA/Tae2 family protein